MQCCPKCNTELIYAPNMDLFCPLISCSITYVPFVRTQEEVIVKEKIMPIDNSVQKELDRLELLIKEKPKTWIPIKWEYRFKDRDLVKRWTETPIAKRVTAILCVETGEIKEI